MRRAQLLDFVGELVQERWTGPDADVAEVVLADEDAFSVFAWVLNQLGDSEKEGVADVFDRTASELSDDQLDWLVGETHDGSQAENPAAYLAAKAKEVAG